VTSIVNSFILLMCLLAVYIVWMNFHSAVKSVLRGKSCKQYHLANKTNLVHNLFLVYSSTDKYTKNKLCTNLVLFTRLYREVRSTKHEINNTSFGHPFIFDMEYVTYDATV
jgi:hypothetical protein